MFRAVLEGVGGGAQTQTWLQLVSDITGVTQVLPQVTVGAAYGDAFLAGRAAGLLQQQDINAWVRVEREIAPQPQPQHSAIYDAMYAEYLRLYLGSGDVVHRLKAITAGHFVSFR